MKSEIALTFIAIFLIAGVQHLVSTNPTAELEGFVFSQAPINGLSSSLFQQAVDNRPVENAPHDYVFSSYLVRLYAADTAKRLQNIQSLLSTPCKTPDCIQRLAPSLVHLEVSPTTKVFDFFPNSISFYPLQTFKPGVSSVPASTEAIPLFYLFKVPHITYALFEAENAQQFKVDIGKSYKEAFNRMAAVEIARHKKLNNGIFLISFYPSLNKGVMLVRTPGDVGKVMLDNQKLTFDQFDALLTFDLPDVSAGKHTMQIEINNQVYDSKFITNPLSPIVSDVVAMPNAVEITLLNPTLEIVKVTELKLSSKTQYCKLNEPAEFSGTKTITLICDQTFSSVPTLLLANMKFEYLGSIFEVSSPAIISDIK